MPTQAEWFDAPIVPHLPLPPVHPARPLRVVGALPPAVAAAIWRGDALGSPVSSVVSSGWALLDQELPGGGWPCHSLSEILSPQPSVLEWRLLGPALRQVVAQGGQVVVVGPPKQPHLPGLLHEGLDQRQLVWIQTDTPAERLWVTEQLIKSGSAGALVAWVPQARQEQIRRLQVSAQSCPGLVFLCRPEAAQHEASAAPLRVHASYGLDWELRVQVFKRRGAVHDGRVSLPSVPGGLVSVLTPRLQYPSQFLLPRESVSHAVGSLAPRRAVPRPVTH
ncbi:MAG: translesion DNA synthesis-associated protein ImuA [Candidatus Saccharibacteria bacterium]|nr:translesion DNA synthesis-associated protein ImuA [Rhodoferax sp.]